ncbi:MAG: hypothetical protein JNK85_01185 [Verrucomicrobiales bacterium]|nr:hypothetical protein [Verrucomicrobiales bacterium]
MSWFLAATQAVTVSAIGADPVPAPGATTTIASVQPVSAAASTPASAKSSDVGWQQLDTPEYPAYLERLRAAGCPEDRIRWIVRADADDWLLQQRVAQAVANDFAWWKAEAPNAAGDNFTDRYEQLRKRRGELITKYIGGSPEESADNGKEVPIVVNLSGPVLGALPREKYNAVQEICARSLDRHQGYFNNRQNEGVFLNQGDLARLREQTRSDLSQILTPLELEEFLLRYSHNANRLRTELAGLDPTPDEFRQVFRSVDALEHRLQLEYGAVDSLSSRQREEFERQREEVIKKVLPPERYQRYLVGRYPLFRQAQLAVRRAGLPENLALGFYEVLNQHESKRREVLNNTALSSEQRQLALQSLEKDKEESLKRALGEEGYRQYRESLVN